MWAAPGGYTTAAEAAARGERVALVERDHLGGTCLNRGCIPTKVICHGAEARHPFADIATRRSEVVEQLREGVATVLRDVTLFHGNAIFADAPHSGRRGPRHDRELTAPRIIVATGSAPASLPIPGAGLAMSSDHLLELDTLLNQSP